MHLPVSQAHEHNRGGSFAHLLWRRLRPDPHNPDMESVHPPRRVYAWWVGSCGATGLRSCEGHKLQLFEGTAPSIQRTAGVLGYKLLKPVFVSSL